MSNKLTRNMRRKIRTRRRLKQNANGRLRRSIFRSSKHNYAQIIDDEAGHTLAHAGSLASSFKGKGSTIEGASEIGKLIAQAAKKEGVRDVIFDRGAYLYHGRVKALAEAARQAGLNF